MHAGAWPGTDIAQNLGPFSTFQNALKTMLCTISAHVAYGWTDKPAKSGSYRPQVRIAKMVTHAAAKTTRQKFKAK